MKKEYSDILADTMRQLLDRDDWNYYFDEEQGLFDFYLSLGKKVHSIHYTVVVNEDSIITYGICPIGVERSNEKMMARMAEFICRANYGLKNGCFELDFWDGEIRYKSYIDCEDVVPSDEILRNSLYCVASMFQRYSEGITDIIFTDSSAEDAIDRCEHPESDELYRRLSDIVDVTDPDFLSNLLGMESDEMVEAYDVSEGKEDAQADDE